MFTDINIYPINNEIDHILEKYIFYRKKSFTKVDIFSILGQIWSRIRINMKRIQNTDAIGILPVPLCIPPPVWLGSIRGIPYSRTLST